MVNAFLSLTAPHPTLLFACKRTCSSDKTILRAIRNGLRGRLSSLAPHTHQMVEHKNYPTGEFFNTHGFTTPLSTLPAPLIGSMFASSQLRKRAGDGMMLIFTYQFMRRGAWKYDAKSHTRSSLIPPPPWHCGGWCWNFWLLFNLRIAISNHNVRFIRRCTLKRILWENLTRTDCTHLSNQCFQSWCGSSFHEIWRGEIFPTKSFYIHCLEALWTLWRSLTMAGMWWWRIYRGDGLVWGWMI